MSSLEGRRLTRVGRADGDHVRAVARREDAAGSELALVAGGADDGDPVLPGELDGLGDRVEVGGCDRVAPDREVEHADVVVALVLDGPQDPGHDRGRAPLAGAVQHLDADDVGLRRDPAELHVGVAALVERQRRRAVAGDQAGYEGAVTGVVVRLLRLLDEVLPADDAAALEVRRRRDPAVEDRHSDAGARGAAVGRRGDPVETDRQVGDVEGTRIVESEHGVVGDDHLDGAVRGD